MGEIHQPPNTDEEGYLIEPRDRNKGPAGRFALQGNIRLTGDRRDAIFELFPHGYVKQDGKIAGMKCPRGCGTG
jgi:sulfur relay (sulfurtransferase) DsrC/TusE family protein